MFNVNFAELEERISETHTTEQIRALRHKMKITSYCELYGVSGKLVGLQDLAASSQESTSRSKTDTYHLRKDFNS